MDEPDVRHITDEHYWWTGRITALCGATAEAGEYEVIRFSPFGPPCLECKRLDSKKDSPK